MGKSESELVPFLKRCLHLQVYPNILGYVQGANDIFFIDLPRKYKNFVSDSVKFLKEWKNRNSSVSFKCKEFNYSAAKQAMKAALRKSVYLECINESKKIYRFLTDSEIKEIKRLNKTKSKSTKEEDFINLPSVESDGYVSSREQLSPASSIDYDSGVGSPSHAESEPEITLMNVIHDHNFFASKSVESPIVQDLNCHATVAVKPEESTSCSMETIKLEDISGNGYDITQSNNLENIEEGNSECLIDVDLESINFDSLNLDFLDSIDDSILEELIQQTSSEMQTDYFQVQESASFKQEALPNLNEFIQMQYNFLELNKEHSLCSTEVSDQQLHASSQQMLEKHPKKIYKYMTMCNLGEKILYICEGKEIEVDDNESANFVALFDDDLQERMSNLKIEKYFELENHLFLILQMQDHLL